VHRALAENKAFDLHLIVTGMHHLPEFATSLNQVRTDKFGSLHDVKTIQQDDSAKAMAQAVGHGILGIAAVLDDIRPDIVLLQGDRGEMLAGAISAAHMNLAVVHMSGGDFSGSIDDSVRNAISKFSHFHLTSCDASTRRLAGLGEAPARIIEVGEPALDLLRTMDFLPLETLAAELKLPSGRPFLIATLHPVTDESDRAAEQMKIMLEALAELDMPVVVTYPNSDAGGRAMRDILESWRGRSFIRIVSNLGSQRYLSLLRHAAAMIGNSSSGIIEAPALKVPVVNIGSRQQNRLRANNVVDVACERAAIVKAVRFVLGDAEFRRTLAACRSPYGDGHAAERTVDVLSRLKLGAALIAKWRQTPAGAFLTALNDGV
jgi:GDP/UDP-N,N'-diacetylbacillosamine 2-epimerase (hydrolysing)